MLGLCRKTPTIFRTAQPSKRSPAPPSERRHQTGGPTVMVGRTRLLRASVRYLEPTGVPSGNGTIYSIVARPGSNWIDLMHRFKIAFALFTLALPRYVARSLAYATIKSGSWRNAASVSASARTACCCLSISFLRSWITAMRSVILAALNVSISKATSSWDSRASNSAKCCSRSASLSSGFRWFCADTARTVSINVLTFFGSRMSLMTAPNLGFAHF